ncbi:MAG: response regulator transcription factor, partial [Planctomycetota bacterium]|nr:response regulator transcription factor [Planctomycetota bacterium]
DDDPGVRQLERTILERRGIEAVAVASASEAKLKLAEDSGSFDLILLDISMPGQSGWDFMADLREGGDETPVIFLTAHHRVEERVRGFELGADDYILKPFEPAELIARIEAVERRRNILPVINFGDLRVDLAHRVVERSGTRIDCSPREFEVLGALLEAKGRILSKAELLLTVWGLNDDPGTKVVEVQVARLRRKLDQGQESMIETVLGEGYRFVVPNSSAS